MSERLNAAMRQWREESAQACPPPDVEQAVLAAFDRAAKVKRQKRWLAVTAASAAALALAVWMGPDRPEDPQSGEAEFVALPYVVQPAEHERVEVVRMTVPVAELIAAGLTMRADPASQVEADFVIGQDGRARAVRLAESF